MNLQAKKQQDIGTVISQECLASGVYSMWIETKIAYGAKCGQFVSIYLNDEGRILPRPISLCEINPKVPAIRVVYRVAGEGTKQLSNMKTGDKIKLLGSLGNGFPVYTDKKVMLIGGGIGVPPMLGTAKVYCDALTDCTICGTDIEPKDKPIAVMGYRDNQLFLKEELESNANLYIATDDGSVGTHGTVIDCIKENNLEADVILACGPKPMLRAVKEYALEKNVLCYVSMEERMACGIGACLACVCKTTDVDDHSKVKNARVCADGPVFLSTEVDLS